MSPRPDVVVRPAREDDLLAMGRLAQRSYQRADPGSMPRSWPDPAPRDPARAVAWAERARPVLETDPGGAWVADVDGEVVGIAVGRVREGTWLLSSFAVGPELQGRGLGRQLMAAAAHHGRGCLRAMLCSSSDPAATATYVRAGFELHPFLVGRGLLDRSVLPTTGPLRDGSAGDVDLLDSLDRGTRGAGHGPDHEVLLRQFQLVVADRPGGQGYLYVNAHGTPQVLAATTTRIARDLLWEALSHAPADRPVEVFHVQAANQWAVQVLVEARLELASWGHLAVRGMKPPLRYLPHGSLL